MKIKDMPKSSRPRERFLEKGASALSDAELFAILLRTGTKGENVIEMSNRLIAEHNHHMINHHLLKCCNSSIVFGRVVLSQSFYL